MSKPETKKEAKARLILEKMAAKKAAKEKAHAEIFATPVAKAVEPLKAEAVARAEKDSKEFIERLKVKLAEAGNDINQIAPQPPSFGITREEYRRASGKRALYKSLTEERDGQGRRAYHDKSPLLVDFCEEKIQVFIEKEKESAALQYEAFVYKLVRKIGPTVKAEISGSHVWGNSILTVEVPNGEVQRWKTQHIVNRSVYGLLFNQWPTRKVK